MKTSNFKPLVRVMVVCALVAFAGVALVSQGQATRAKLPTGNWSFSAGPRGGVGYRYLPVDVFKVKTSAARGLAVESVSLLNQSLQAVKEIRLHWSLKEESKKSTLAEGDTEFLEVALPAGGRLAVDYPITSFVKLYKPLMHDGVLSGNYRIEVAVNAITFADGSKWTPSNPAEVKLAHAVSSAPEPGCQGQGCLYNAEIGSYMCASHSGTFCAVGGGGQSCEETRCPLPD